MFIIIDIIIIKIIKIIISIKRKQYVLQPKVDNRLLMTARKDLVKFEGRCFF